MESAKIADQSQPTGQPESHTKLAPALEEMGTTLVSPRGTVLFQQGQQPTHVLVLRKGKVRLSHACEDGQHWDRTVGPGHILGLLATVADQPYRKTAETLEDCEFASVDRMQLMALLRRRNDFWLEAVRVVSEELRLIRRHVAKSNGKQIDTRARAAVARSA
ncbi:MAG TPA: cyclic nucleotide-binding domain-containing protein [Terriglobales bacterium]|jgi:CRP-like cAMP-binding protein|nr:cyclic nucleotide-binding domain-containing protein [Terriglobales bacterium]